MQPQDLIHKHYANHAVARRVLLRHSGQVARYARQVVERLSDGQVDARFVEEAAWLHDIGMLQTNLPQFGCPGRAPYLCHGVLGAALLEREGLDRHAKVCERHIGVGLSIDDIRAQNLPLPLRDMRPRSIEEEIVAYADLFFSKKHPGRKTIGQVRQSLARHGPEKVAIFNDWHTRFGC